MEYHVIFVVTPFFAMVRKKYYKPYLQYVFLINREIKEASAQERTSVEYGNKIRGHLLHLHKYNIQTDKVCYNINNSYLIDYWKKLI